MPASTVATAPEWAQALDALVAKLPKEEVALQVGTSWRTIHRLVRRETARPCQAVARSLVRVAKAQGLLAA